MSPEEAARIARHHLGEHLRDVVPVGSGYNVLIHLKGGGYTSTMAEDSADLPAVCCEAASQLRAQGWVPTHPRLVWAFKLNRAGDCALQLHTDQIALEVARLHLWTPEQTKTIASGWAASTYSHRVPGPTPLSVTGLPTMEEAAGKVVEWCATTLPSLHLPPFPAPPSPDRRGFRGRRAGK